tara:strand:- start:31 stop:237 length:207 start_codon:yes stop_codon:yes gene_type:complete
MGYTGFFEFLSNHLKASLVIEFNGVRLGMQKDLIEAEFTSHTDRCGKQSCAYALFAMGGKHGHPANLA